MNFRIGQKVVCIAPDHDLVKGNVYTVSRVGVGLIDAPMIDVAEVTGQFDVKFPMFFARRFRPAVERKTDISIFTAMLTSTKSKVDA